MVECAECHGKGDCECQPRIPTQPTLRKYGLSADDYARLAANGCHVCGRFGATRPLAIDHAHVKGWKSMPPDERRRHVRGVLCYLDNRFLGVRGVTPDRLRRMANYLERHELGEIIRRVTEHEVATDRPRDQ